MIKAKAAIAGILSLFAVTAALAQSAPANMPYHTVYGRIGATPGDTGPGQAIPFTSLLGLTGGLVAANNLSDLPNKATARTNLGVAIGTNVEAWDADLDCLAALGTTGIIRRTGAGTCSASTLATLAEGGTNAALTADFGGIVYSTASAFAILPHASSVGFPMLSGAGGAPTWATIFYPTSATSGGVAYFSSTTQMASSALLAANQIMLGGGAGIAPATLGSLGTTTTVLHGNAGGAPSFAAVSLTADVSGVLPVASGGAPLTTPAGRLTLTTGVPITISDVAAATSVFYAFDGNGGAVPINGVMTAFTQLTLTLNTGAQLSGGNYDYFIGNDSGTIRLCTGPAWTAGAVGGSAVARGTGAGSTDIQQTNGIWVNTNTMTCSYTATSFSCAANACTYVGTGRMTANGQTEDSFAKRFLWNAHNQVTRPMRVIDATANWAYGTATTRQANGSTANQLAFVTGLVGSSVDADIEVTVQNSTATARSINFGIGLDSTTTYTQVTAIASCTNAGFTNNLSRYRGFPGLGFHFLSWNETGAGTDTQTWYGTPFSHLTGSVGG